jgi:3-hydroxyacyl-CoA dehydrogenase/enoyl-CoA hydratase/3-hydroxybutyryl-CoA epimerase
LPQWFEAPASETEKAAFAILAAGATVAADNQDRFVAEDRNLVDLHCQQAAGFPAYLGGPFTFLARYGGDRCRSLAAS